MDKINLKEMIEGVLMDLVSNMPIDNYIYKLRMIAKCLDNSLFSDFVNKEFFDGYSIEDEIPKYRLISSTIKYSGIVDYYEYNSPMYSITDDYDLSKVEIRESIPKIIDLSNSTGVLTQHLTEDDEKNVTRYANIHIYKEFSGTDIMSIPREVKTCLLDMIVQLNDDVFNDEINFNVMTKKDEIQSIVTNTINAGVYTEGISNISGSNIVGGQGNNVNINSETKNDILDILKKIEELSKEIDEDREDIAEAIITIRAELENKIPNLKLLGTTFKWLGKLGSGIFIAQISGYVTQALAKTPLL